MLNAEFKIIEDIKKVEDYIYGGADNCTSIDDDIYIDCWWDKLILLKTYFHSLDRPEFGLARYGITLIPPESLPAFQEIVISDKRINMDDNLAELANLIQDAIRRNKFIIHYGV